MSSAECLAKRLDACNNPHELIEAIDELVPAICAYHEELKRDAQPIKVRESDGMTAREEFNKMLNSCTHPRFVYNVLAAFAVAKMMGDAYDKH